jgi:hypothetical protein
MYLSIPTTNIEAIKSLIKFVVDVNKITLDNNHDGKISTTETINAAFQVALVSPDFLRQIKKIPIEATDLDENETVLLVEYTKEITKNEGGNEVLVAAILALIRDFNLISLILAKRGKLPAGLVAAKAVKTPFKITQIDENTFSISSTSHKVVGEYSGTDTQTLIHESGVYFSTTPKSNLEKENQKAQNAQRSKEYRNRKKAKKIDLAVMQQS